MKNFIKTFSFLFILLSLASCGKDSKTNSFESKSTLNGYTFDNFKTAVMSVPAPGMVGGGISITINGKDYQIDSPSSSVEVQKVMAAAWDDKLPVSPLSKDRYSTNYRVAYLGSLQEGKCTFNPMATCTNAVLSQLIAY